MTPKLKLRLSPPITQPLSPSPSPWEHLEEKGGEKKKGGLLLCVPLNTSFQEKMY